MDYNRSGGGGGGAIDAPRLEAKFLLPQSAHSLRSLLSSLLSIDRFVVAFGPAEDSSHNSSHRR